MLNRVRDQEIRHLRLELRLPVDEIARRFRVSRRTVFRILQPPHQHAQRAERAAESGREPQTTGMKEPNGARS